MMQQHDSLGLGLGFGARLAQSESRSERDIAQRAHVRKEGCM
jgi:hypothetical protein